MSLFTPIRLGSLELPNRMAMAPMTRLRAGTDGVPGPLVARYYAQRATVGLIVAEATYPSRESRGYVGQTGICDEAQAAGWAMVAHAVHEAGGRIVLQLMHAGRASHPAITGTQDVVGPSALAADGQAHTLLGKRPYPVPRALDPQGIADVVADHVRAARLAVDAGLDGVEVHSANGYLLHEFLASSSNCRTDGYGGSVQNRTRLSREVVEAVVQEIGAERVGVRISPQHNRLGVLEQDLDDVTATYGHLVDALASLGLAYLSVLHDEPAGRFVQDLRHRCGAPLMLNSGFGAVTSREDARDLLAASTADVVAIGRPFIANPDLVTRWRNGHPESDYDPATIYGDGPVGYTDYPALEEAG